MVSSWHSYPKVYNLGHRNIFSLLDGIVCVEEKVDGSQFSFGVFDGEIKMRSKGREFGIGEHDEMFNDAVSTVIGLAGILMPGYTYRGEYLRKPKHNALAYNRIPEKHIVLFDIEKSESFFMTVDEKQEEAKRIGLECVPCFYLGEGMGLLPEMLNGYLATWSFLGGQQIEGVVIKNHDRFGADGKALMGKHVSEAFKEVHGASWKASNPNRGDIVQTLIARYKSEARWRKAVQHLAEAGNLEGSSRDIGNLIVEVRKDVTEECRDEIRDILYQSFWGDIERGIVRGLAEWYKDGLMQEQFKHGAGIGDIKL